MKLALAQFAVSPEWPENARKTEEFIARARAEGADMLILPEGILARNIADPDIVLKAAQPLDGPFMQRILAATRGSQLVTCFCIHVPTGGDRVHNVQVALRDGEIIAAYRKLHLYDAFKVQESQFVAPGDVMAPLLEVAGFKVGLMTCYDLRFPEMARALAVDGADLLVLPAAWVRGPGKEHHWNTLVTARALENTLYLAAVGECGTNNIGASMVVDPLGVVVWRAAENEGFGLCTIDATRLKEARAALPALANRRFKRPELA